MTNVQLPKINDIRNSIPFTNPEINSFHEQKLAQRRFLMEYIHTKKR